MNLERLAPSFFPHNKIDRDHRRRSRFVRLSEPFFELFRGTTPIGRGAVVLATFAAGLGMEVSSTQVYLVWSGLMGLLVASLIVRRFWRLDGVGVRVIAPRRVAAGETVTIALTVTNEGERNHQDIRVSGPLLPWDGRWMSRMPAIPSLGSRRWTRVECQAVFSQRGVHHLDPFRVAALVPLGLMTGKAAVSTATRFVVVPRIAPVGRLQIPLVRRYQPGGIALASKTGESMELLGVRPYKPGDPMRNLHARTWARIGTPVVREYQEEYFTRVGVLLDTDRRVYGRRQFEASVSLAAGIVSSLTQSEALIDMLVVGDQVHLMTLGRSLGHLDQALDLLACVRPGPAPQRDAMMTRLAHDLQRLSCMVLVVQHWDEARAALVRAIESRGTRCRVVLVDRPAAGRGKHRHQTAPEGQAPPPAPLGMVRVPTEAIEKGDTLWL